jgi:hypothetical protein
MLDLSGNLIKFADYFLIYVIKFKSLNYNINLYDQTYDKAGILKKLVSVFFISFIKKT